MGYITKDSGERDEFLSGMMRDTTKNKARYDLLLPNCDDVDHIDNDIISYELFFRIASLRGTKTSGLYRRFILWYNGDDSVIEALAESFIEVEGEMILHRFAELMARGAEKYNARNWEKANSENELMRFKESAIRHFGQYLCGFDDEDHAAATLFNIMGYQNTKRKIDSNV